MQDKNMDILQAFYSHETTDKIQPSFIDVKKVADNIEDIKKIAKYILTVIENKTNINIIASLKDNILSVDENKSNIIAVNNNKDNINVVAQNEDAIKLLKDEIEKLQFLYNNYNVYDSNYVNKNNIEALSTISDTLTLLANNITSIQNAKANADNALAFKNETKELRDQTEEFRNETKLISGGSMTANNVLFSDSSTLEDYKIKITNDLVSKVNIADIVDNLTSSLSTAPLSANQGKKLSKELEKKMDKVPSTDNAIPKFNGIGGDIQNTDVLITDNNDVITNSSTSPYDTTFGRLLRVGDFGLGKTEQGDIVDLNGIEASGTYRFGLGSLNIPSNITYGTVHAIVRSEYEQTQIAYATNTFHIAYRYKVSNVWADWVKVFNAYTAVINPVSSLSMSPIIETGSNANGYYTKFLDGTLICTYRNPIELDYGGTLNKREFDWSFPHAFTILEYADLQIRVSNQADGTARDVSICLASSLPSSNTNVRFSVTGLNNTTWDYVHELQYYAIGRWR